MNKNKPLSEKKVIIASYTHISHGAYTTIGGPALTVKKYLLANKIKCLVCIWQPVPISDTLSTIEEVFENGKEVIKRKFYVVNWPFGRKKAISLIYVLLKFRDIISTLTFSFGLRGSFDIFIGVESLNTIIGILLRRIRLVRTVIYYNLDYAEVRFKNRALNYIFHALDIFAVRHADYTWNLAEGIIDARNKRGVLNKKIRPPLLVPIGIDLSAIKPLDIEQIERNTLVYLGILAPMQGVQLIVEALPEILKSMPDVKLIIIGSGQLEETLKLVVAKNDLAKHVTFTGIITNEEANSILCSCALGIAPYFPDPNSAMRGSDPTKPKMYLACGLPVIITRVPPIARLIEENKAGLVIGYSKEELVGAVLRLLSDEKLYLECRKNALEVAKQFDWINIMNNAFSYDY
ncbi:MAG: glycosyltransferase [Candidatus Omnitrophica bacterium]|nr:glycosyltransferase [Candidatus Omnitrophota bacterium]